MCVYSWNHDIPAAIMNCRLPLFQLVCVLSSSTSPPSLIYVSTISFQTSSSDLATAIARASPTRRHKVIGRVRTGLVKTCLRVEEATLYLAEHAPFGHM